MASDTRWQRFALVAAMALIVLAVLISATHGQPDWFRFSVRVNAVVVCLNSYCVPFLMIAATLVAWKRAVSLAVVLALFGVCSGLSTAALQYYQVIEYVHHGPAILAVIGSSSNALAALCLVFLLLHRLPGNLDLLARRRGAAAFSLNAVLHNIAVLYSMTRLWGTGSSTSGPAMVFLLFILMLYLAKRTWQSKTALAS